ncbi:MAG: DUF2793 domain-containing protein [Rhizobiaceae bacterium]|nr:DUF2793 domain-containing protein [Rhizobiaceae bacterium]MCV0408127.1 DUF2793 domain-containing protein [Rhizobiaceae bacterium]
MSDQSPNLDLPYILPSQAQKHVTHNEAVRLLDSLVQLAVLDRDRTSPPGSSEEGDRHVVAAPAEGEWSGQAGAVAVRQDGGWSFLEPRPGWLAWVVAEDGFVVHDGEEWRAWGVDDLQDVPLLGLGTVADATNPFAAKLNKALWTARYASEGGDGDLRYTLNKEAPAGVLSMLMQSDWSGRAELGLIGDDDFGVKVSPDGATWHEALKADRASGAVSLPGGLMHAASGAPLHGLVFTPGGDGQVSIWRIDAAHAQNPRVATVSSVAGDTITLTAADAGQFGRWTGFMAGVSLLRVWNVSKAPAQSAWVRASATGSTLQVTDASDIAGWSNGETVQIGDPTAATPGRVIALDISPMMTALFGAPFRQSGLVVKAAISGSAGDAVGLTPSGVGGSFVNASRHGSGDGVTIVPCSEASPVSGSNLVFLREDIATTATVEIVSTVALIA